MTLTHHTRVLPPVAGGPDFAQLKGLGMGLTLRFRTEGDQGYLELSIGTHIVHPSVAEQEIPDTPAEFCSPRVVSWFAYSYEVNPWAIEHGLDPVSDPRLPEDQGEMMYPVLVRNAPEHEDLWLRLLQQGDEGMFAVLEELYEQVFGEPSTAG